MAEVEGSGRRLNRTIAIVKALGRFPSMTTREPMKANLQTLIAYATGALALVVVTAAAVSALTYAVLHRSQTLTNLATSTLSGIGMAVGGCLGSALILRFKAARRFLQNVIHEVHEKHG